MIPAAYVTDWGVGAPWSTRTQIEQDLLLSRLICEFAQDDYLGRELLFRGGTCLHKLHLRPARRYSEDLDYVRSSAGGLKSLTAAVTAVGERLGFDVRTRISEQPKMFLRTTSDEGLPIRIKVEVNTRERSPADPAVLLPFTVSSPWWSGTASVRTFTTRELMATKIRALFERDKGRDLYDLWLALTELGLTGADLLAAFAPYHSPSITADAAIANLRAKLATPSFRNDLTAFVPSLPSDYDIDAAAEFVITEVLEKLPAPPR